jgi:putative oxidoreductase
MVEKIAALRERSLSALGSLSFLPPALARFTVGWVFVLSGWGKLHNLERVTEFFRSLGIPAPEIQAPFTAATELVCGALLLAGLFTRLAVVPLVVVMIVAIKAARLEELGSLNDLFGFIEFLYVALLVWLGVSGPGTLSLDTLVVRMLRRPGSGPRARQPERVVPMARAS